MDAASADWPAYSDTTKKSRIYENKRMRPNPGIGLSPQLPDRQSPFLPGRTAPSGRESLN
jgi:hypothetical protein